MKGALCALYSACAYIFFFATFLFAIAFVEGIGPKTLDSGAAGSGATALAIDLALLTIFALQHSVMARPGFKRVWTRIVPKEIERSTYVVFASAALALLIWKWQPLPQPVWTIADARWAALLRILSFGGWALVLISTFLISHLHLFGVLQGFARLARREPEPMKFVTPLFYRWVRHPLYVGFILAFWAAPAMSLGHLLFAAATTGYILLGIWLEERDMAAQFGTTYLHYRERVGMLLPKIRLRPVPTPHEIRR